MKIKFGADSSATYSGFSKTRKKKSPTKLTGRERIIQNIKDAEESVQFFKDASNAYEAKQLAYAKEDLARAKKYLELLDSGLSEEKASVEAFNIAYATHFISLLKSTTGLSILARTIVEAASNK